jgi:hypothetical protein
MATATDGTRWRRRPPRRSLGRPWDPASWFAACRRSGKVNCPQTFVSATAAPPPPPGPLSVSRTRVRNQRRTTTAVGGLCDGPHMGHLLGYARVSTTDQQPQLQVDALERAGCYRVFTETASGAAADRPTLEQVLDQLRPGDTLAESERDLIRERTAAGLAAVRVRGRRGGRPSVMTAHKLRLAQEMYRSGQYTVTAIASTLGVSRASVYRHLGDLEG